MEALREEASSQLSAVSFQGRFRRGQFPRLATAGTPHSSAIQIGGHPPRFLGSDGPIRSDQKSDSPRERAGLFLLTSGY
jgi:hypothetical protein